MSRAAETVLPAPLPTEQQQSLTALADTLAPDALMWASGYLAGIAARGPSQAHSAPLVHETDASATLTVFYATETGNSRRVAEDLAAQAQAAGMNSKAVDLRDTRLSRLKKERRVVFVAATHGLGDAPDGTEDFFEALASDRAPDLSHLEYSVLSLGDSSYDDFCQVGIDLDARLSALGANRVVDRVDCDIDFADDAQTWSTAIVDYGKAQHNDAPTGAVALRAVPATPQHSRTRPFAAPVLVNQRITGRDSSKSVHHVELSLEESGLTYEPGDALGVVTANPDAVVGPLLEALQATGSEKVRVGEDDLPLADALRHRLDVTASGRRFAEHYANATQQSALSDKLSVLGSDARAFFWQHQIVDLLQQYPGDISPQTLVDGLRTLQPRLYSIASSLDASPEEVHLTVAQVQYQAFGQSRFGSASTAIANAGDTLDVYVEANPHFRLPADNGTPIIMIGPGTGIAPFRSFLEHRAEHGAQGKNWLFFGDRTMRHDFLYQLELQRHFKRGTLQRLDVAFSRDQDHKIYVQDRLRERSRELVTWLDDGAHIYVCGDAERMAPDVHDALRSAIADVRDVDPDAAEEELRQLKRDHRYQKDVY